MIPTEKFDPEWFISQLEYKPLRNISKNIKQKSIEVIGFDTEADITGKPFMFCDSNGIIYKYNDIPHKLFNRTNRNSQYVVYNLKYDSGAILHHLPLHKLQELQVTDETEYNGIKYSVIGYKMLRLCKGKNCITFWDIYAFYETSLNRASEIYLNDKKLDQDVTNYSLNYISANWFDIAKYCIHDSLLTKRLADIIIGKFESFGVFPQALYSTAYVSWKWFQKRCDYIHVKRQWDRNPRVLEYAIQSYNGGKFEVTQKGPGYYYEYDIVSAYPYEISNLIDIRDAKHCRDRKYHPGAVYGFIKCRINIDKNIFSPIPVKRNGTNIYPVGWFDAYITKAEYEYLISLNIDVKIFDAEWLYVKKKYYPYKEAINELMQFKNHFKQTGEKLDYMTVKIFLNSFYGKMIQMIDRQGKIETGSAWNPIYASVITANCRLRVTELQNKYPSIIATHTDSVISNMELPIHEGSELGQWEYSTQGDGIILGTGVYQIGGKSRFRGFRTKRQLLDLIPTKGARGYIDQTTAVSWRTVAHRSMETDIINRFITDSKIISPSIDTKRFWIDDYKDFSEVRKKIVYSYPWKLNGKDSLILKF